MEHTQSHESEGSTNYLAVIVIVGLTVISLAAVFYALLKM